MCHGYILPEDGESAFHPNYPFEHILWAAVNARWANKWWQDNFIRHADKVQHGVKKITEYIDGDAPVAADRAHNISTSLRRPPAGQRGPAQPAAQNLLPGLQSIGLAEGKKAKKRKRQLSAPPVVQQQGRVPQGAPHVTNIVLN